jgi:dihydroorotate dehydrogenase
MLYERLLKPALFALDAETAHDRACLMMRAAQALPGGLALLRLSAGKAPRLPTRVFGVDFPSPLGLAAGFDKDGVMAPALAALGFGFIEVGSVTLRPQPGNDKPRLFRLPQHQALINRMGFNSCGANAMAQSLRLWHHAVPIGVNLGLNRNCAPDRAPQEYAETFEILKPFGDYFVVNVSSPNTAGLRDLQESLRLRSILEAINAKNAAKKPVLVKLTPDIPDTQLDDTIAVIERLAQGVVAGNTTLQRFGIPADTHELRGGLSGAPLRTAANELIKKVRARTKLPIIGVGGIFTGEDALEKLSLGASLVQMYTGFIYRGPTAAADVLRELCALMGGRGLRTVADAVGKEATA